MWMAGGMAAPETFDPKRYTPFEIGVPSDRILCTFPAIDTAVDNIKISEGLEHVGRVMDRATLTRSHVVADLGNILQLAASVSLAHGCYVLAADVVAAPASRLVDSHASRGRTTRPSPRSTNIGRALEGVGASRNRAEGVH